MEYLEFKKMFIEECDKNGIKNVKNVEKFYKYMKLILEWNEKINVTSITDEKMFLVKHFIDSLEISEFLKDSKNVIDVGTGGGFPGVPLKMFHEEQSFVLLDSVSKKIKVVEDVVQKLNLKDIKCLHGRAEEYAHNFEYREKFDVAVSRAVANMSTLVEYLIPFVKVDGLIVCMKGPSFEEELEESSKAINMLGGKIESVKTIYIDNEIERNIIVIKKIKNTPNKYPRGQGKPLKEPIK